MDGCFSPYLIIFLIINLFLIRSYILLFNYFDYFINEKLYSSYFIVWKDKDTWNTLDVFYKHEYFHLSDKKAKLKAKRN